MLKLKQIMAVAVVGTALLCSTALLAAAKYEHGSHASIDWIKAHYKNCTDCKIVRIKAGACAKNKNAHVHYYCKCDDPCDSGEYLSANGRCEPCPSGAKCDGKTAKCDSGLPLNADGKCLKSWDEVKKISCGSGKYNIIANGSGMGVGNISWSEFYKNICKTCPANAVCDGIKMVKETIDEAAMAKAKQIREKIKKSRTEISELQKKITADEASVTKLNQTVAENKTKVKSYESQISGWLTEAADIETSAHKLGNLCMKGSHESYAAIKSHNKNCTQCKTVSIKDGECERKKGAHKHYYCYCDC